MEGMLLLRLTQMAISTRRGCTDKAMPSLNWKLEGLGYAAKARDGGYVVLPNGFNFLRDPKIRERVKKL